MALLVSKQTVFISRMEIVFRYWGKFETRVITRRDVSSLVSLFTSHVFVFHSQLFTFTSLHSCRRLSSLSRITSRQEMPVTFRPKIGKQVFRKCAKIFGQRCLLPLALSKETNRNLVDLSNSGYFCVGRIHVYMFNEDE